MGKSAFRHGHAVIAPDGFLRKPVMSFSLTGVVLAFAAIAGIACQAQTTTPSPNATRTPLVGTALSCGTTGTTGGLGTGTDLQRYDIDTNNYPYALCNDGSNAVLYFRPFQGEANRNRWLIFLQGGGSCGNANDCANRWCSVDTNFSSIGMSTIPAPGPGINGNGILNRRADNPIGGWNLVLIKYCSSDKWSGTARDVILDADDPKTGAPVLIRMHFLGSRIVDAAIQVLRQAKGEKLTYTLGSGSSDAVPLPNLDDARFVLLAGASGGGNGVVNNLDRLAAGLKRTNNNCTNKDPKEPCPLLDVRGLHDSAFNPSMVNLDFTVSAPCRFELCSPEAYLDFLRTAGDDALWRAKGDASCAEWHRANAPDLEWRCADEAFVIANHVTTPLFVRQGQTDRSHLPPFVEAEFRVIGESEPVTAAGFAKLVRDQAAALADVPKTGNEGAAVRVTPGAFIPTCSDHETLTDNPQVYTVRIRTGGANNSPNLSMFDVLQNWLESKQPSILIAPNVAANTCPPAAD